MRRTAWPMPFSEETRGHGSHTIAGLWKHLLAEVLAGNTPMLKVFQHSGLPMRTQAEDGVVHVVMELA